MSKIYVRSLATGLISVAAHLYAIHFVDRQVELTREMKPGSDSLKGVMTVTLAERKTRPQEYPSEPAVVQVRSSRPSIRPPSTNESPDRPAPAVDLWLPPDPHYFPASELTEKPRVLHDIPDNLAAMLNSRKLHSAILRLQINEQGAIDQVIVDFSEFPEAEQKLLVEAFSKMKFEPGKLDEMPVKSEMRIEILMEKLLPFKPLVTPFPDLR